MVVVLIIGILIAVALPIMLGARSRAQDRQAHSDLRNGVATAKIWYTDSETFTGFTGGVAGTAEALEPNLDWGGPGDPGATGQVSIVVAAGHDLLIVRRSDSGRYFCLSDQFAAPGFSRGGGATFADVDSHAECVGGW